MGFFIMIFLEKVYIPSMTGFELKDPRRLMWILAGFGIGLRLLLFWVNPPQNSYDDHFEPVFKIMIDRAIPSKDACWECFQPPLFYVISAVIGKLSFKLGANYFQVLKILQFVSCLYGIATIWVIYLILKRLPLSDFARLSAFGTVCFLPRHIYASAMFSNDTMVALAVSLCVYLTLVAIDKRFSLLSLAALSITASVTLMTKHNALIVLPMISIAFVMALFWGILAARKSVAASFFLVISFPLFVLGWQITSDINNYGRPFPSNMGFARKETSSIPGKGNMSFFNFKTWKTIAEPILTPESARSFWTGVYGSFWFDLEPKFLQFTDHDSIWWGRYYNYLQGKDNIWPGIFLSRTTMLIGGGLIFMGLVPLLLVFLGFLICLFGKKGIMAKGENRTEAIKNLMFPVLFIGNAGGMMLATVKYASIFPFLRATYFLPSLGALISFLGVGVMFIDRWKTVRYALIIFFAALFLLVTVHILHIFIAAQVPPPILFFPRQAID